MLQVSEDIMLEDMPADMTTSLPNDDIAEDDGPDENEEFEDNELKWV